MRYLIDGYNLLFRIEPKKGISFEKRRNLLIETLDQELAPFKGGITVVFDSSEQPREVPECAIYPHLEVVYAPKGLSADGYLIELVDKSKNRPNLTVVTSDSGLTRQCQHLGAYTLSIDAFLELVERRNNKKKPKGKPDYSPSKKELERLTAIFEKRLGEED